MIRLTKHAQDRITQRLQGITTVREVMDACEFAQLETAGEQSLVIVKQLPAPVVISFESNDPEHCSKGDIVAAIVKNEHIITVMLRKSWSKSERYQ